MLKQTRTVRKIAREIADAAESAFSAYQQARVEEEPQITGQILGAIEERMRNQQFGGVVWQARTLRTGRGVAAEEKRHGADLMGVLDVDLPGYRTKKGFLAQAKKAEPERQFSSNDWQRLRSQCETMLERTSDSFVFIYSLQRGIRVFPANAILALGSRDIFELYDRSLSSFFESHIECFIGDSRLNSTEIKTLDALVDLPIDRIFELSARPSNQ